ncbi:2-oxoglutarate dehydrogenase E1 component [Myxococcus sp. CA051A]|uniref:2-oxoglutarate dehydrogenase E1 component n=1 Tax=unclassified Myxococcus TaxID=2648731 RepID=UPI00157A5A9A|nr:MULTISPECIES: 2-oxoglutarate dehydrogenase E1 component [unclassified Myxococcus]NTX15794.1 2-oxoglutarate dehydrogenase E1 component [Myxococcus sp. CA056]NTX38421.1 2-oxoglutarate dehydrogenase E1 component [Myxococcus sp. CA033]NTX53697.1 2-oxoglutarate dehydrogenase E1 component [Myxococcus sp. CA039A]NTX65337.1 2-oxoglutarate dehydrogenase E1 component [Myxococcus sp. CA051A]
MANFQDTFLSGANIDFIEGLYARYLEDPASVDSSWREVFERNDGAGRPIFNAKLLEAPTPAAPAAKANGKAPAAAQTPAPAAAAPVAPASTAQAQALELQSKVDQALFAFRLRGHLRANLDPLGRPRPALEHVADVGMVDDSHFSAREREQEVESSNTFPQQRVKLGDLLTRLHRTYTGSIGVEVMQILDSQRRRWLMQRMEHSENRTDFTVEDQRHLLTKLSYAEGFENFLHTKYVGAKRFSLDGGEALIPMLDAIAEVGSGMGLKEIVIGMAHRGRLNVLTNILGKQPSQIFSEFDGPKDPKAYLGRGDVKYHMGFSSDHTTRQGKNVHLSLAFNPSHLEAVNPVVEGRVRAKQERGGDTERVGVMPLLIHGDAAFMGQGVVAETLNLSGLKGYATGGTIHVVINNQVGFTTDPHDSRSSIYATAIAQMLDIPIFHVNGDDPEACVHVARLAAEYRQTFHSDVVIDLICYRRYGHNEGDDPSFTQPAMYELIRKHPTVRTLYAKALAEQSRISAEDSEAIKQRCLQEFDAALVRARQESQFKEPSALEGLWKPYQGGSVKNAPQVATRVDKAKLRGALQQLSTVPEGFHVHRDVERTVIKKRLGMLDSEELQWSEGETLAYATLLSEGHPVRLSGQDCERGTFSHRHAVLHDVQTGEEYTPLKQFATGRASFQVVNSALSEMGVLGFEYGYSLDVPDGLTIWEAQFGDFANGAQIIIDQFIAAAESKWRRLSGITLLLPHSYEGQGPEHSSARLERFLDLSAEDNIQVCYPTTPAQIFHLLRRQVLRPVRKPLVIMSPKSLLRRPEATSKLDELATGSFQEVILDKVAPEGVTRLLLCSGKVYYDLVKARDERKDDSIAIVRLEQLYPFPFDELANLVGKLPKLAEIFWVQEEPRNAGAWHFMFPRLHDLASSRSQQQVKLGYIGRAEAASPATGFPKTHEIEQQLIIEEAIFRGTKNGR